MEKLDGSEYESESNSEYESEREPDFECLSKPIPDTPIPDIPIPAVAGATNTPISSNRIPQETRAMVCGLRRFSNWSYSELHQTFHIPLASLHGIIQTRQISQAHSCHRLGCPLSNSAEVQRQLISTSTASAHNRPLPLSQVAQVARINIGQRALMWLFHSQGYHRRVARVKPYLSPTAKEKRKPWGERFQDWTVPDWQDVIWSDECAFSIGQVPGGTVWVTPRAGEEYLEECLVPQFPRQTTIMVWGAFYCDLKGPLVIWDMDNWGKINGTTYCDRIIHAHLYPWYCSLHSTENSHSGYIYFQQDGALGHHSEVAAKVFAELGIAPYHFPWPPSSPDMSTIECISRIIKTRIRNRHPRPTTTPDLRNAITEEWDRITLNDILNLTSSLPERLEELLLHHRGHTYF